MSAITVATMKRQQTATAPPQAVYAARWRTLVAGFTGGDPEVQNGLNKMYADQANWPESQRQHWQIKPEIQAFIMKAMK